MSGCAKLISRSLAAAPVCDDLVGDLLAIPQARETRPLDSTDVDKNIGAAGRRLNEPIALLGVEPLHGSCLHVTSFRDRLSGVPNAQRPS